MPVYYKVRKTTRIRHLETKQFLASMATEKELTTYLSKRLALYVNKVFMISFERTCLTNIPNLDGGLNEYAQEKADTGIVLHPVDICKQDPLHPWTDNKLLRYWCAAYISKLIQPFT